MKKKLRTEFMLALILLITNVIPMQAGDTLKKIKVSLDMPDATVKEVLVELKTQSGLTFFYSNEQIDMDRKVAISLPRGTMDQALVLVFKGTDIQYKVSGAQILLIRNRSPQTSAASPFGEMSLNMLQVPSTVPTTRIAGPNVLATITGKVVDEGGVALPGVSVLLKGTSTGTTTNADGIYTLNVPASGGTLVFTYIGYSPKEVEIGTQTEINISMDPDLQSLMEVVVVGYGEQKKADVTGATATVTTKDFNTGVINNPLQAIQGKVAGLSISTANSDPTNNRPVIRLRGTSSLTANAEPLIVIDGVIGAPLNSVAPEDIEKYDVLKDASAAAIYGSRGANGVIIITTKRGKTDMTQIDYNAYVGFAMPYKLPDVYSPDEYFNKYNELNPGNPSTSAIRTDWFKETTRTAVSMNHNIGISGGSEKSNYRGSVSYLNQPGIAQNSEMSRVNARLNLTQKAIDDKLELQLNLSANTYDKKFVDYRAFNRAAIYSPLEPVFNADDSYFAQNVTSFEYQNPVAMLKLPVNEGRDKQILGNFKATYEIVKNLKAGINTSYSTADYTRGYFLPKTYFKQNNMTNTGVSYAERNTNEIVDRLVEYTLSYSYTKGASNISALLGYSFQKLTNTGFDANASDIPDQFSYNNLGAGANNENLKYGVNSYKSESKLDGLLARVNYSLKDRYLLTLNFRRDGSSRFGKNNRYGFFPSASAGWKIIEEPFMQNVTFLSNLKLRAGYGVTGNQNGIGDYASRLLIGPSGRFPSNTSDAQNPLEYRTAYFYSQNANPDLKWETSAMLNIGVDFGLLQNRLTGSIEFYNKDTRNLLFYYTVNPGDKYSDNLTYISSSFLANVGSINNRGVELSLDFQVVDNSDFQWSTAVNLAYNKNKVAKLSGEGLTFPEEGIRFGTIYDGTNGYGPYAVLKEGLPVGTFWGPKEIGLDENGVPLYEVIDTNGNVQAPTTNIGQATRQNLGNPQPKINMGWSNSITYKNFDLTIFFRGSFGQKVYNASRMVFENPTSFKPGNSRPSNIYQSTFEGDNAKLTKEGAVSSRYVENASFVRLDNVNLGYTLPNRPAFLRSLRLYVAAQNLLVITGYSGLDPEVRGGATSNNYGGVDNNNNNLAFGLDDFLFYPKARTFTLGLSATF